MGEELAQGQIQVKEMATGEQTLLDSTAVLFGSGMGNANSHTNTDLPIILAGGGYGRGEFRKVASSGPATTFASMCS